MRRALLAATLIASGATAAHAQLALDEVPVPAGWERVPDALVVWRDPGGQFVSVAPEGGTCLARGGLTDPRRAPYFYLPTSTADRISLCLQGPDGVAIVTMGTVERGGVAAVDRADVVALVGAVADRLHPGVALPVIGAPFRPALAITARDDGFAIAGLDRPTRVTVVSALGACGTLPPGLAPPPGRPLAPLPGPRWSAAPRGDAGRVLACLERADDAIALVIDDPALAPGGAALAAPLVELLAQVHDVVAASAGAPRFFGGGHPSIELPRTRVTLSDTLALGGGWRLRAAPSLRWKLVDGAGWDERGADLLVPTVPHRYAIGFRPARCTAAPTGPVPPREAALFPRELGAIAVSGHGETWRAEACARGTAGSFAVVVRALRADDPDDPSAVRTTATAFARSVGVAVRGTQFRLDTLGLVTVPIVWSADNGTRAALAMRGRASGVWGRPFGLAGEAEFALGVGGESWDPRPEDTENPDHPDADLLAELRGGIGVAATFGPLTLDVLGGAVAQRFWPDGDWLTVSAGATFTFDTLYVQARYRATLPHRASAAELVIALDRIAIYGRLQGFADDTDEYVEAGRPRTGLELGVGASY